MDELLLHENETLSAAKESHYNVKSDFDENEIYHIENTSLEDTK